MTERIVSARILRRRLPLQRAYVLSFARIESFETWLSHFVYESGDETIGEVVPLPGYSCETVETVERAVTPLLADLNGLNRSEASEFILTRIGTAPFACSLLLSALDVAEVLTGMQHFEVPIVYPTCSGDPHLPQSVAAAIDQGFQTIKVKIGGDLKKDLCALKDLEPFTNSDVKFRFDANQAYSKQDAITFFRGLESALAPSTELVEQPLPVDQWQEMKQLCAATSIPLMLDESLIFDDDVDRAADVGARWVKLKLCKQRSAGEIVALAQRARGLGLKVVLGNGVATDVANMLELAIHERYSHLFSGASESNGFAKLLRPVRYKTLRIESGKAAWSA